MQYGCGLVTLVWTQRWLFQVRVGCGWVGRCRGERRATTAQTYTGLGCAAGRRLPVGAQAPGGGGAGRGGDGVGSAWVKDVRVLRGCRRRGVGVGGRSWTDEVGGRVGRAGGARWRERLCSGWRRGCRAYERMGRLRDWQVNPPWGGRGSLARCFLRPAPPPLRDKGVRDGGGAL